MSTHVRKTRKKRPKSQDELDSGHDADWYSEMATNQKKQVSELETELFVYEDFQYEMSALGRELQEHMTSDEFQKQVAWKSNTLLIGRQEAEIEVCADIITAKKGTVDKALLFIVSQLQDENKIIQLMNHLVHRGANTSFQDSFLKTPLHYAVKRKQRAVTTKLLESNAFPHLRDKKGKLPLKLALDNEDDDMCSLLLAYMPNAFVRHIFTAHGLEPAEVFFHRLLDPMLQKTVISVLDCMIQTKSSSDNIRVFYHVLEADRQGRPPDHELFNPQEKSPLQIIAKIGNKNIVYHDVVRLLILRKWKKYARLRFQVNTFLYMVTLFCLTFAAIVAVTSEDPTVYNSPLQVSRAVAEVISLVMVFATLFTEINQLIRHRIEYFTDLFNYMDASSTVLLALVAPLRYAHNNSHWTVFAFGYLFWTVRIFKYAAIFRQTGAYSQILYRVLKHDFPQFSALFAVVLLAFGGTFLLALRGEDVLDRNNETSSFWRILYVGVRTLTESQPVIEYAGNDDYKTVSEAIMVVFVFACIVILTNILIAQLSDTYQKVQQDAQRGLEVNRAWIVAKVELNNFFPRIDYRRKYYRPYEDVCNIRRKLTQLESPPLNEMNRYIKDIWDTLDTHKLNLLTVQHRMARQENILRQISDHLRDLRTAKGGDGVNRTSQKMNNSGYLSDHGGHADSYNDQITSNGDCDHKTPLLEQTDV